MLAVVIGMLLFLVLLFGAAALFSRRSRDPRQPLIGTRAPHTNTAFIAYSEPDAHPHEPRGRDEEDSGPRAT